MVEMAEVVEGEGEAGELGLDRSGVLAFLDGV